MASEALNTEGAGVLQRSVMVRTVLVNLAVGFPLALISSAFGLATVSSFGFGFILGLGNMLWLLRIANRGLHLPPQRAGRYVFVNYLVRFSLMVLVLVAVVTKNIFLPVPLMAGVVVPVAATIALTVKTAREFTV